VIARGPADPPSRRGRVAFVSCEALPELTSDDRLALDLLAARGHDTRAVVWTDASVDWAAFDVIVLRSCWDYHLRPRDFAAWLDRIADLRAPLENSVALSRWNMEKGYLHDLEQRGVPVVPTRWLEPGSPLSLAELRTSTGWTDIVVKPAISATAWRLFRLPADVETWPPELAQALEVQRFLAQPFQDAIIAGEWSLVFFDGRYSHAVLKRPRAGDFRVQNDYGGSAEPGPPPAGMIAAAVRVLDTLPERPLYARVDGVDTAGGLVLLELELLEPALFLATDAAAAARFVDAIERRLSGMG
jgi:glutathione synthase/RimK-type ligase-like ATP-grasp enzyme